MARPSSAFRTGFPDPGSQDYGEGRTRHRQDRWLRPCACVAGGLAGLTMRGPAMRGQTRSASRGGRMPDAGAACTPRAFHTEGAFVMHMTEPAYFTAFKNLNFSDSAAP